MLAELIDLFTLLATLPDRAVVLTEGLFVIVAFLFALELAAPLLILIGLVLKASALPQRQSRAGQAPQTPPRNRQTPAPIATVTTLVPPGANELKLHFGETERGSETPSARKSIDGLARVISEAKLSTDPAEGP